MRVKMINIDDEAAEVLGRAQWNGRVLMLPPGQLDRPLYAKVDKAIRALGGKWDKGARGHVFAQDSADQLKAALESGSVVDQKKTLEQFFTPAALAEHIVRLADIGSGMKVLEPSAGAGSLIEAIATAHHEALIYAVELDHALYDSLAIKWGLRATLVCADFTALSNQPSFYDRAVMNPPFSRGQDMAHVRHAFELLKPGGKLVSVMSPHWVSSVDKASNDFRAFLSQLGTENYDWEELPPGSFRASGTDVNTGLLIITKPE